MECSNNGKKDSIKAAEPIGKSLGFMITESSDPDLELVTLAKKENRPNNRPPTPKRQSNNSDSFSNSVVNFTNMTFQSAEKGNSSGSREDGHRANANIDKIYVGRKQIRESAIEIDLSHDADSSSQEHAPDEFNNIKYKTLEIH